MRHLYLPKSKEESISVAHAGCSLFPALAAAIVANMMSESPLNEQKASWLLKEYLKQFPQEQTSLNRLSALEQWKSMIRPSGGAVKVSLKLARVLSTICNDCIESNPAKYFFAVDGLANFEENMRFKAESVTKMMVFTVVSETLDLGIHFKVIDGLCTIPASYRFHKDNPRQIQITYDHASNEFKPLLKNPERFQSMLQASGQSNVLPGPIDSTFFRQTLEHSIQEAVTRYAIMYSADEITYEQLLDQYIASLNTEREGLSDMRLSHNFNLQQNAHAAKLPDTIQLLILDLAWKEVLSDNALLFSNSLDTQPQADHRYSLNI